MAGDRDTEPLPKRQKTLSLTSKGGGDATSSEWCGICLLDGGARAAIRGEIDSCDHFFCFVCIMEWAKVESRCPICKCRFGSIRRPQVPGIFSTHRIIDVPVRDQVYHIFGNATVGPPDPYSDIRCSICDSVGDENLLLLCDLCDSASHTHCVGLGATVPEGDWFCHDCTVSKAEHEKIETNEDCDGQVEHTSIDDIVQQSRRGELNPRDRLAEEDSGTNLSVATPNFGARTLRLCRNVHARVQALRDNWSAIRNGSLSFSSSSVDLDTNRSESSNQSHFTSTSSLQVTSGSSSNDTKCRKSSYDVEKAWKMLNKAKSMERAHEKTRTVDQIPKNLSSELNNPFRVTVSNSFLFLSSSLSCGPEGHHSFRSFAKAEARHKPQAIAKQNRGVESSSSILHCGESSRFNTDNRHKPQFGSKQELGVDSTGTKSCFSENSLSSHSLKDHESPSFKKFHASVFGYSCESVGKLSQKLSLASPSVVIISEGQESNCFPFPSGSFPTASSTSSVKRDRSSFSKMDFPKRKAPVGESFGGCEARSDDPKSDIQVLVKLSLKLLAGNRELDVKSFKEIARLATHSIMAACGLEQPKPGVRSFPVSVCWHTNQVQNERRVSTLLPNCCRECFHVFVKDVVNSIMIERLGSA